MATEWDPRTFVCPRCMSSSLVVELVEVSDADGAPLPRSERTIACWTCQTVYSWKTRPGAWVERPDLSRRPE